MTTATDPRIETVGNLLTASRLMAGHGDGLIRPNSIARILGVPLADRGLLLAWIEHLSLWHQHPTNGPLADAPEAGTIDLADLRQALKKSLKKGPLPFTADHLQEAAQ
jgi:hypothetical protein